MDTLILLQHYWWAVIALLASLAAENGQGGEALVFSAADRDTVGQAVVDAANGE